MSVLEYMQTIKGIKINNPDQPLLIVKSGGPRNEGSGASASEGKGKGKSKAARTPTWLVPELVEFTLGEKRNLSVSERSGNKHNT